MFVENYGFTNGDWLGPGFRDVGNPSHEAYGPDGIVWSTAAAFNPDTGENKVKRCFSFSTKQTELFRELCTKLIQSARQEMLLVNSSMPPLISPFVLSPASGKHLQNLVPH